MSTLQSARLLAVWPALLLGLGLACAASGCRAPLIDAEIANQGPRLTLLEFDYPDASFGADALTAGGHFRHRIQVRGSGPVTLHFVDGAGKSHTSQGPAVREGESGSLLVTIEASGAVQWNLKPSGQR